MAQFMQSLPVTRYAAFLHNLVPHRTIGSWQEQKRPSHWWRSAPKQNFTRSMTHCYGMILVSLPQVFISSCYLWREVNEEKFQGFDFHQPQSLWPNTFALFFCSGCCISSAVKGNDLKQSQSSLSLSLIHL